MAHEPEHQATIEPEADDLQLPAGDHPVEVAARRGFGPLSAIGAEVWHGQARPCVSCGQLVERGSRACDSCGQDLSEEMLEKMRQHAGPWYVLEHLRPFPGVSLERIVKQIRRGLITETSIVRGPATDYQWRFAVETPSLCRYFNRCWNCHHEVAPVDTYCPSCLTHLSFQRFPEPRAPETARPAVGTPAPVSPTAAPRSPSSAELTKPLSVPSAARPGSIAELTKPLEARPYVPASSPLTSGQSPPAGIAAPTPHLRHELQRVETSLFEPRPAAPVTSAVGVPESAPITFPSRDRTVPSSVAPPLLGIPPLGPAFQNRDRHGAASPPGGPTTPFSPELARLASAVASFDQVPRELEPAQGLPRVAWIAGAIVVIAIVTLIALVRS